MLPLYPGPLGYLVHVLYCGATRRSTRLVRKLPFKMVVKGKVMIPLGGRGMYYMYGLRNVDRKDGDCVNRRWSWWTRV